MPTAKADVAADYFDRGRPGEVEVEAFLKKKASYGLPAGTTIFSSSLMEHSCPAENLLDATTATIAYFDGHNFGHGGSPWWVILDMQTPTPLRGVAMSAFIAAQSPKDFKVECTNDLSFGPAGWRTVLQASTAEAWGSDTFWSRAPWVDHERLGWCMAAHGGDRNAHQQWEFDTDVSARFWKVTILSSHDGNAPTMHYIAFYPVAPPSTARIREGPLPRSELAADAGRPGPRNVYAIAAAAFMLGVLAGATSGRCRPR